MQLGFFIIALLVGAASGQSTPDSSPLEQVAPSKARGRMVTVGKRQVHVVFDGHEDAVVLEVGFVNVLRKRKTGQKNDPRSVLKGTHGLNHRS